jgi:hypothetical protein
MLAPFWSLFTEPSQPDGSSPVPSKSLSARLRGQGDTPQLRARHPLRCNRFKVFSAKCQSSMAPCPFCRVITHSRWGIPAFLKAVPSKGYGGNPPLVQLSLRLKVLFFSGKHQSNLVPPPLFSGAWGSPTRRCGRQRAWPTAREAQQGQRADEAATRSSRRNGSAAQRRRPELRPCGAARAQRA